MNIPGFVFESEQNYIKIGVGYYIKNIINDERCYNLEGKNSHVIIIDKKSTSHWKNRLINIVYPKIGLFFTFFFIEGNIGK